MRRSTLLTAVIAGVGASVFLSAIRPLALAHCEIPCGIYDDHARVEGLLEDATTIGKAVEQIMDLSGRSDALSMNQVTRWTMNKEEHATRIQHTVAQYFMTQRIKPLAKGDRGWEEYATRLAEHHQVIVSAMKCKQTVDPDAVARLRSAILTMARYYPHEHEEPATAPRRR